MADTSDPIAGRYHETRWNDLPNYQCRHCRFASLDELVTRIHVCRHLHLPIPDDAPEVGERLTVDETLAWVDGDPERAAEALLAEHGSDSPRKTLIDQLIPLIP